MIRKVATVSNVIRLGSSTSTFVSKSSSHSKPVPRLLSSPSLSPFSAEQEYKHLKLTKRGYCGKKQPKTCGVAFEAMPGWIWAMRRSDWSKIVISAADELQLRQYHHSTWEHVSDLLQVVASTRDSSVVSDVEIWFVSGSRSYLEGFAPMTLTPMLFWVERCGRRPPANSERLAWFTVSHESVGGSTTTRGVFGRSLLDDLTIEVDPIRRTIANVVKFSIRPTPCVLPVLEHHYVISQRLTVSRLDLPVVYESSFSRTGWGKRSLTDAELAQAFDLPPYLSWDPRFALAVVPIQVFRAIIDGFLAGTMELDEHVRAGPRPRLDVEPIDPLFLWTRSGYRISPFGSRAHGLSPKSPTKRSSLMTLRSSNTRGIREFCWFSRPATSNPFEDWSSLVFGRGFGCLCGLS